MADRTELQSRIGEKEENNCILYNTKIQNEFQMLVPVISTFILCMTNLGLKERGKEEVYLLYCF